MNRRLLQTLGLSLLALVGAMAMSASVAQAKWLLLLNNVSVLELTFKYTLNSVELLVPNLKLAIFCKSATGTVKTKLTDAHAFLTNAVTFKLNGCKDLGFSEVCTVMGAGDPDGTISFSGSGAGSMEGEKVLSKTESTQLADIEFLGEECPLAEVDCKASGNFLSSETKPLDDAATHQLQIVSESLFCGGNPAELHTGTKGSYPTGTISALSGTSATHLVGL